MATRKKKPAAPKPSQACFWPAPQPLIDFHLKTLAPLKTHWTKTKKVPPVTLLTGLAGIGKHAVVYHLAQWLLCEKGTFATTADLFGGTAGREACGECGSCQRALKGTWIDFLEIAPESKDGKASPIKIDALREILSTQGFGAHGGSYRIFFVRDAHRMTPQAANAVLKLLEEPPKDWLFFLTATDASLLLPTIVSRCQQKRLPPLDENTLRALLATRTSQGDICARLSGGSWAAALEFSEDEIQEKRQALFRFISRPQTELSPLVDWAAKDVRHTQVLMTQLEYLVHDLVTGENRYSSDALPALQQYRRRARQKWGGEESKKRWLQYSQRLAESRRLAQAPLNRKIFVQNLLLPWFN